MTRRSWLSPLLLVTWSAGAIAAQDSPEPAFEVVSIRPNASGDERSSSIVQPGARYNATNVTLRMLIKTAYQVHDDQIVDGAGWVDTARFDVAAKGAGNPSTTEFVGRARLMLRPALAERFRLLLRRERREIPVYALVARDDGRAGPQLIRTDLPACEGPWRPVPVAPGAAETNPPTPCDSAFSRPGHAGARGRDISTLVTQVFAWADRVVVDRTGLAGKFDWDLQWSPEGLATAAAPAAGVSLFTALREQLGLKLEPTREPVEVLVIERAERPMPD
jgi:uncharacterized protein (TIGR03435 family)